MAKFLSSAWRAAVLLAILTNICASQFEPYLGEIPPGNTKHLFAYGTVTTPSTTAHGAMYFTPDGREAYWSVFEDVPSLPLNPVYILESHVEGDNWTTPTIAPFSGVYEDNGPFLNHDASRLYFMSDRPETPGGERSRSFWYVERAQGNWSEASPLGEPFSSATVSWQGSLVENGDLYFSHNQPDPLQRAIFLSRFEDDAYQPIERVGPPVYSEFGEYAPFVAPDGSYLLFASRRPGGYGSLDLYICFAGSDGSWGEAQNLGPTVNTSFPENFPSVSPDGDYLFWIGPGPADYEYYWISASVIDNLRPECCSGRVGDANLSGDEPTIGDLSVMIDAKFISESCDGLLPCYAEADVNQSGGSDPTCDDITIGDVSYLIDYLFITGEELGLPDCL